MGLLGKEDASLKVIMKVMLLQQMGGMKELNWAHTKGSLKDMMMVPL